VPKPARCRGSYAISKQVTGKEGSDGLLQLADQVGATLIVIGMRKRSQTGNLLFGSYASRILLEARCPVLARKTHLEGEPAHTREFARQRRVAPGEVGDPPGRLRQTRHGFVRLLILDAMRVGEAHPERSRVISRSAWCSWFPAASVPRLACAL
jgi:hypothetical protein